MNRVKIFLFCCALCYGKLGIAQNTITGFQSPGAIITEYDKAEWTIQISAQFTNAFDQKDIALDMILTTPSGNPVSLPCYFDNGASGSSVWKARFAPQEIGKYFYYFHLLYKNGTEESHKGTFIVKAGKKAGFLHKNGLYTFKFDNGDLFRGIGENVGWEARTWENPKYTYDLLLPPLAANGVNFFRTWMCPWNLPLDYQQVSNKNRYSNTTAYFNPSGIKRMEELLHLTDSLHLYIMLTLDMNSGKKPEWFYSQVAMDKYKNKLRYLVARWGYSTNIAAWEFFNEIDNGAFTSGDSILIPHHYITNWHDEMSRYLKDIDPYKHLVTTSISHRDIAGLNSIAYIDFNQKHIYKHTEKIPGIYPDYIQTYGKPYVIGEFGYRWEDADPKYAKEADYDFKRGLWFGLFSPTPILPMSWWWEFFHEQKMEPYFRAVRAVNDQMLASGKGNFEPINVTAGLMHVQAIRCGNKSFVYLLNESDEPMTNDVKIPLQNEKNVSVKTLVPVSMKYGTLKNFKINRDVVSLPAVTLGGKQEIIIIITNISHK